MIYLCQKIPVLAHCARGRGGSQCRWFFQREGGLEGGEGGGVGGSRVITLLLVSHCKRGKREGGALCVKMGFMRTFSRESRYNSRSKIKFW